VLGHEPVRPNHVTDVGEVPTGSQVADHDVVDAVRFGVGDASGEAGSDEIGPLPGADVVEGAEADHVLPGAEVGSGGNSIGCHLRRGVRIGRMERLVFRNGQVGIGHQSVDLGAGHREYPLHPSSASGVEDVLGALDIGPERSDRVDPGGGHVSLSGEVVDDLRAGVPHVVEHGVPVRDVGAAERAIADDHVVAGGSEVLLKDTADEAGAAGDECSHQRRRTRRRETGRGCWSTELTNR